MTVCKTIKRSLYSAIGLGVAGLLLTGCAIQEAPGLPPIERARTAIDTAKQEGAAERFPEEFAALEQRYLETRGVFYSCDEKKASEMATALAEDAAALAMKRTYEATPEPLNQMPKAVMVAPREGEVNQSLQFRSTGSRDPDGDPLTFAWSFGDGTTSSDPDPVHAYAKPGSYTVGLTVSDNRNASDNKSGVVTIVRRIVLKESTERVLFDFDRSTIKPAAEESLAIVVKEMKENDQLRAEIVGHADATGPAAYNMGLSERRAEAVQYYLISKGVKSGNLSLDWKGEAEPIATNKTKEGRAQNRRVEITVRPGEAQ